MRGRARKSRLKPVVEPGRMPRLDQRGECACEHGFGLAENIPP